MISGLTQVEKQAMLGKSAAAGDITIVEALAKDPEIDLNAPDLNGNTPLMLAIKGKHKAIVTTLLAKNVNIHAVNTIGETAFHLAIEIQELSILGQLLSIQFPESNPISDPLLISAVKANSIEIALFLLDKGFDANVQDNRGNSAIYHALFSKVTHMMVPLLLSFGANINSENHRKETPLFAAVRVFPEWINAFVEAGADITHVNEFGKTLLMQAVESNIPSLRLLLDYSMDLEKQDCQGNTVLSNTAAAGYIDAAEILLARDANIHHKNNKGQTVLEVAAKAKQYKMISFLVRNGADPSVLPATKLEPLPEFKYYSAEVIEEMVGPSFESCDCCKKRRGVSLDIFHVNPEDFEDDEGDDGNFEVCICPWCIESGKFYKKFKTCPSRDPQLTDEVENPKIEMEFYRTTPPLPSWQEPVWIVHCGEPCKFLGCVGWNEIADKLPDIKLLGCMAENPEQDHQEYLKYLDKETSPRGYLFECLHCKQQLMYYDCD